MEILSQMLRIENHEINESKVRDSLEAAQLKDLISSLPEGLRTKIGDNGIDYLGQRQELLSLVLFISMQNY